MAFVKKSNKISTKVQAKDSAKDSASVKAKDSAKSSETDSLKKQNEITAEVIKLTKEAVSKLTDDMGAISGRVEKLEQNDLISKLGDYDKRLNVVEELVKKLSDRLTEVSDKLDSALEDEEEEEDSDEEDDEEDDSDEDEEADSDEEEEDSDEDEDEGDSDEDDSDEDDSDDEGDSDEDGEEDSDEEDDDDEEIEIDPDAVLAVYNGMSKPEQLKLITKVKSDLGLKGRVLPKVEELVKDDDSLIAVATVMVDDFGIEAEQLAAEE